MKKQSSSQTIVDANNNGISGKENAKSRARSVTSVKVEGKRAKKQESKPEGFISTAESMANYLSGEESVFSNAKDPSSKYCSFRHK